MAKKTALPSALLLLFLVLVATGEMMGGVEARTCESQSHKFKGTCVRESNCASVCETEGFSGGVCRGVTRRCYCTRNC